MRQTSSVEGVHTAQCLPSSNTLTKPHRPIANRPQVNNLPHVILLAALCVAPAFAQSPDACAALRHHGQFDAAQSCYTRLAASPNPALRAEGLWHLERWQDANTAFRAAVAAHPDDDNLRVRWGLLYLDHWQDQDAAKLFQEALKINEGNAQAWLGLARAAGEFSAKAVEYAEKAAQLDPKLAAAHELLASLALEDSDPKKAAAEADNAIAIDPEALDAMAVHATIDFLADKTDSPWPARILKINPVYGEAYASAARILVINRRYIEGIALYRKALELNPRLWYAHSELGINLMRLGQQQDARRELETAYNNGYKDPATTNSLTLLDSYKNFVTVRTPHGILRLHKKESALLAPYFEEELERCIATYNKKYGFAPKGPVQIEVYPDHEDFAVRTMGMPGLGALGVTFGSVVAMDSPSGRPPGSFHWASTLWHEMSHVYVLQATNHRVPRWFTEGMAVYEETATSPDWGDRLDPGTIDALAKKKLLPVAELDRGFIRPSYPSQVVVSYFQAGKICQFIAGKWGYSKLLDMMYVFAKNGTTPQAIQTLGLTPEQFDQQFFAWLDKQTGKTVSAFAEWKKDMTALLVADKEKHYDEVIAKGPAIRDMYPDYVEPGNAYDALADAYIAKGEKAKAREELERYSAIGGRSPRLIKSLAAFEAEAGDKKKAAVTLTRLLYIYPEDTELHRRLGSLLLDTGDPTAAVREFRAELATNPVDTAQAHYDLARALHQAARNDAARDEVLAALETAPNFKPAQQLLLELAK